MFSFILGKRQKKNETFISLSSRALTMFTCIVYDFFVIFFSGTAPNYRVEEQNKTLSTEYTYQNHFTSIMSPNSSSSPIARKTVENKNRILVLIAVIGTFISTLLLVAIGFELRTRIILCRREPDYDQENMFCGNGNYYAQVNNIK